MANVLCADVGVIDAPTLDVVMHVEPNSCPVKFERVSHVGGGPARESPMHLGGWRPLNFLGHVPKVYSKLRLNSMAAAAAALVEAGALAQAAACFVISSHMTKLELRRNSCISRSSFYKAVSFLF